MIASTKRKACQRWQISQSKDWSPAKISLSPTLLRTSFPMQRRWMSQLTGRRRKTLEKLRNTWTELNRTFKESTRWSKTFTNSTMKTSTCFFMQKNAEWGRSEGDPRRFEEEMGRGEPGVSEAYSREIGGYYWSEEKEIGLWEATLGDRGRY